MTSAGFTFLVLFLFYLVQLKIQYPDLLLTNTIRFLFFLVQIKIALSL